MTDRITDGPIISSDWVKDNEKETMDDFLESLYSKVFKARVERYEGYEGDVYPNTKMVSPIPPILRAEVLRDITQMGESLGISLLKANDLAIKIANKYTLRKGKSTDSTTVDDNTGRKVENYQSFFNQSLKWPTWNPDLLGDDFTKTIRSL